MRTLNLGNPIAGKDPFAGLASAMVPKSFTVPLSQGRQSRAGGLAARRRRMSPPAPTEASAPVSTPAPAETPKPAKVRRRRAPAAHEAIGPEQLLAERAAAARLGMSQRTFKRHLAAGSLEPLRAIMVGARRRYDPRDVERYIEVKRAESAPAAPEPRPKRRAAAGGVDYSFARRLPHKGSKG